jgi:hypothetical protein
MVLRRRNEPPQASPDTEAAGSFFQAPQGQEGHHDADWRCPLQMRDVHGGRVGSFLTDEGSANHREE